MTTDEKTELRKALAPFALVGSELPEHVRFTISVLDGTERMLQIDQEAFVQAFKVYTQTAEENLVRNVEVRRSNPDVWPLTDATGKPFYERGANRIPPNPKPEYDNQTEILREVKRDTLHGLWLVPLVLFFLWAMWIMTP